MKICENCELKRNEDIIECPDCNEVAHIWFPDELEKKPEKKKPEKKKAPKKKPKEEKSKKDEE